MFQFAIFRAKCRFQGPDGKVFIFGDGIVPLIVSVETCAQRNLTFIDPRCQIERGDKLLVKEENPAISGHDQRQLVGFIRPYIQDVGNISFLDKLIPV